MPGNRLKGASTLPIVHGACRAGTLPASRKSFCPLTARTPEACLLTKRYLVSGAFWRQGQALYRRILLRFTYLVCLKYAIQSNLSSLWPP
jgi:hypothetical protein